MSTSLYMTLLSVFLGSGLGVGFLGRGNRMFCFIRNYKEA